MDKEQSHDTPHSSESQDTPHSSQSPPMPPAPERPLDSDSSNHDTPHSSQSHDTPHSSQSPPMPPAPERPLDSDCCGGGCQPCVMDIYEEELDLWRRHCQAMLRGESLDSVKNTVEGCNNPEAQRLSPTEYKQFCITDIKEESRDILRIRCWLPAGQTLGLVMGQHVIIRFVDGTGSSTTRQYTPTSSPSDTGFFEIMIKIYAEGRASQYIKKWKVGDNIDIRGPAGKLSYTRNKYDRVLMLCAGTGVAPMCQVSHSILADEEDDTTLRLVYAARDYSCLMAKREINEWRRFWNFSCVYLLSQEPENPSWNYGYREEIMKGHLSVELIKKEIGPRPLHSVLVLVCGTRDFDTFVLGSLESLGVPQSNIHKF